MDYYGLAVVIADEAAKLNSGYTPSFLEDAKDIAVSHGLSREDARKAASEAMAIMERRQNAERLRQKIAQLRLSYEDKILQERLESLRN